uniref:Uncharacterized protein n=1 Tax=Solanum lycopersicum TaxID=4081 RepID=A0A3Q7I2N8_SOLLC
TRLRLHLHLLILLS